MVRIPPSATSKTPTSAASGRDGRSSVLVAGRLRTSATGLVRMAFSTIGVTEPVPVCGGVCTPATVGIGVGAGVAVRAGAGVAGGPGGAVAGARGAGSRSGPDVADRAGRGRGAAEAAAAR